MSHEMAISRRQEGPTRAAPALESPEAAAITPGSHPSPPKRQSISQLSVSVSVCAKVTDWEAGTMEKASSCFRLEDGPHSLLVFVF